MVLEALRQGTMAFVRVIGFFLPLLTIYTVGLLLGVIFHLIFEDDEEDDNDE